MSRKQERIDKEDYLYKWPIGWIIVLIVLTIFTLFAPLIFSIRPSLYDFPKDFDKIATGIGVMSPFVAICAAILTYLAFRMQFLANKKMLSDSAKQQVERQFYEMLKIHKDNVNKLQWKIFESETENVVDVMNLNSSCGNTLTKGIMKEYTHIPRNGNGVLSFFLNELTLIYLCVKEIWNAKKKKKEEIFFAAYEIFFEGIQKSSQLSLAEKKLMRNIQDKIRDPRNSGNFLETDIYKKCGKIGRCNVFTGHRDVLNSYYRHLFYTVKTVVNSPVYKDDDERLTYLKILRSQMTSEEQTLLLFNWYAGYGTEWECKKEKLENHFFTQYKMIHNIEKTDVECVFSEEELKKLFVPKYIDEEGWKQMFEFEERKQKLQEKT
jgi:hypothetical protein